MPRVDCSDIAHKVTAVFSVPRTGWTANMFCAAMAARDLGIGLEYHTSAYWSASLEKCLQRAIDHPQGFEFALTIDYDTVFSTESIVYLYALMKASPEQDAIAAMQLKRTTGEMMSGVRGPDGSLCKQVSAEQFSAELVPVSFAHFGLTMIRLSALKNIPRPWFLRLPDPEKPGESIDDDMYFWQQWERHGKILSIAAHNPIGHLQEMIAWPAENLATIYQPYGDFERNGPSKEVRQYGGRIAERSQVGVAPKNADMPVQSAPIEVSTPKISDGSPMLSIGGQSQKPDDKAEVTSWGRLPEDKKRGLTV